MSIFNTLASLIDNGDAGNLPVEQREDFFEAVANVSENRIAEDVGSDAKNEIMGWWYDVCDQHQEERKGG